MFDYLASFGIGFAWGYLARWQQTRKDRPIRMVRHDQIVPGMPAIQSVIADEWRTGMQAFTLWTERTGLSELAVVKAGLVSNRGYRRYVGVLRDAGILVAFERSRTHYAPGWCGAKVRSFLRRGKISLSFPPTPPPVVHMPERLYPAHADLADARRRSHSVDITEHL